MKMGRSQLVVDADVHDDVEIVFCTDLACRARARRPRCFEFGVRGAKMSTFTTLRSAQVLRAAEVDRSQQRWPRRTEDQDDYGGDDCVP